MPITQDEVKSLLGHDKFSIVGPGLPDTLAFIQQWLSRFTAYGWNPKNVRVTDFDHATVALHFDQVPWFPPATDHINIAFEHKKTGKTGIYGAFVPSHYPTAADLIYLAQEDPT